MHWPGGRLAAVAVSRLPCRPEQLKREDVAQSRATRDRIGWHRINSNFEFCPSLGKAHIEDLRDHMTGSTGSLTRWNEEVFLGGVDRSRVGLAVSVAAAKETSSLDKLGIAQLKELGRRWVEEAVGGSVAIVTNK